MENKNLINDFSRNLKRLRQESKLSQEQLSFRCELTRAYVGDLERGLRNPSLKVIEKIVIALETDIHELFRD
jgi:transcriptional regulator with XRE-family HTH domain